MLQNLSILALCFDAVITDQTMPNLTGAELSKKLLKIRPDLPIILCTGFSDVVDEDQAKALGIHTYIKKPVVIRELAKAIRSAVGKTRGTETDSEPTNGRTTLTSP